MGDLLKSKLFRNLGKLSPRDRARFGDFVASPFFNTHRETHLLADCLLAPDADWGVMTKKSLSVSLFPQGPVNEAAVSNVMSYLMKLLDRFLGQLGLEDADLENILAIRAAHERGLTKLAGAKLRALKRSADAPAANGSEGIFQAYLAEILRHDILRRRDKNPAVHHLRHALDKLDEWYLVEKLKKSCELMALTGIGERAAPASAEVLAFADHSPDGTAPLISLYQKCLLTIVRPEEREHYFALRGALTSQGHRLPAGDRVTIYRHLLNYCAKQINRNLPAFRAEMYGVYQEITEAGLLMENGILQPITYTNLVSLACSMGELAWAGDFLRDHRRYLPAGDRENIHAFNLAKLRFYQGRYDETLEEIAKVRFTNLFYQIMSRILQLKVHYQRGDDDVLDSNLESLRLFLLRSPDGKRFQASGNRMIAYLKQISRLRHDATAGPTTAAADLLAKINGERRPILEKDWLKEQLAELV